MSDDRDSQVQGALVKGLVALVAIGLAIGLGTLVTVRALGLDEGSEGSTSAAPGTVDPLPTTALPVPSESTATSGPATGSPSESASSATGLRLDVSPTQVGPGERINFTGSLQGGDNLTLEIQRFENGTWTVFPVPAPVTAGTFQTYIQTTRTGEQRFRVFDPQSQAASNEVTVTVG